MTILEYPNALVADVSRDTSSKHVLDVDGVDKALRDAESAKNVRDDGVEVIGFGLRSVEFPSF